MGGVRELVTQQENS